MTAKSKSFGGSVQVGKMKPKNLKKAVSRYRKPTELTDAVLIVEDEKFHVIKLVSRNRQ